MTKILALALRMLVVLSARRGAAGSEAVPKAGALGGATAAVGLPNLGRKVVAGMLLAAILSFGGLAGWRPAGAAERAEPAAVPVAVTPRGHDAWEAFQELARQGGPKVLMPGGLEWLPDR